jgi:transcriptional regulator of aromatic amino acid metabolism
VKQADIERAARNAHLDVLITGETGTSKTFSARQIHDRSRREHPRADVFIAALACVGRGTASLTSTRYVRRALEKVIDRNIRFGLICSISPAT